MLIKRKNNPLNPLNPRFIEIPKKQVTRPRLDIFFAVDGTEDSSA